MADIYYGYPSLDELRYYDIATAWENLCSEALFNVDFPMHYSEPDTSKSCAYPNLPSPQQKADFPTASGPNMYGSVRDQLLDSLPADGRRIEVGWLQEPQAVSEIAGQLWCPLSQCRGQKRLLAPKPRSNETELLRSRPYTCNNNGCGASFADKRGVQRHAASVHGQPIKLPCGQVLKNRSDNIARHGKHCPDCPTVYR